MPDDSRSATSFTKRAFIAAGAGAAFVVALGLLWYMSRVLLLVFGGVLLGVFLGGLAKALHERTPLPRGAALGAAVLFILAVLVGFGFIAGPRLSDELGQLSEQVPEALDRLQQRVTQAPWAQEILDRAPGAGSLGTAGSSIAQQFLSFFSTAFGALTNALIVFIIGLYLAISPQVYVRGVLRLVPPQRRDRGREVLHGLGRALRWWLVGRFASMAIVGVLTGIGLFIAGVPLAFTLGFIAAVFSFVPYIGPIASAVPALLVGFAEGPQKALYVVIVYVAVQLLESYLITPLIQERAVSIPPALLITAQVIIGVLAGVLGVLLATPLAVVLIALVQMLYVNQVLGDDMAVLGDKDA